MTPRDNPPAIEARLEKFKWRVIRAYAAVKQWEPNDRPLKIVKAHLENIDAYIKEVEKEIRRCTQSSRSSSRSRKRR